MKMHTAADVEAAGPRLLLGQGDRLTPLARDRAKELGVELVLGDAPTTMPLVTHRATAPDRAVLAVDAPKPTAPPSRRPFVWPPSGAM
jgi:malate dehydrogenase